MLAVATLIAFAAHAQTVQESTTLDNWYVGLKGGVGAQTTQTAVFKSLNPIAGFRFGRWLTPVFGLALDGEANFDNKQTHSAGFCLGTVVKSMNLSLLGTTNLSNWISGYRGEPRLVEVSAVYGLGWGYLFGTSSARNLLEDNGYRLNYLTWKMGFDVACNFGYNKEWQVFVEPSLLYRVSGDGHSSDWAGLNINRSTLRLTAGIIYKLPCSNGTHNFRLAPLRNQQEIDALNETIRQLRTDNEAKDLLLADKNATISEQTARLVGNDTVLAAQEERIKQLQYDLLEARARPTDIVASLHATNLQPTVLFRQGKTAVDNSQLNAVERVANYMKKYPESQVEIRGYASRDEDPEKAEELAQGRADAVKKALVKRYKISSDRLNAVGMGATNQLFNEVDFNRIVTFNDNSR